MGDHHFMVGDRDTGIALDPGVLNPTVAFSVSLLKLDQWKPCPTLPHPLPLPSVFPVPSGAHSDGSSLGAPCLGTLPGTPTELVLSPNPGSMTCSVCLWAAAIAICFAGLVSKLF